MAIRVTCPSCKSSYTVDDVLAGKKVRCRDCDKPVVIPAGSGKEQGVTAKAPRGAAARKGSPDRREDSDDQPRRGKKAKKGGSMMPLLLIGGGVVVVGGLVLLLGGVGLIFFFRSGGDNPAPPVAPMAQGVAPIPVANPAIVAGPAVPPPNVPPGQPPVPPVQPPAPVGVPNPALDTKPVAAAMDGQIPLAVLQAIKDATAYIKMDAGQVKGSGSGFVMKVEGTTAYVVTNDHVVTPPATKVVGIGRLRAVTKTVVPKANITVVLRSGTPQEQAVPAEVLTADPEADLAVLRITNVPNLPRPIDFSLRPQLVETMPLFIFGFPFGQQLATNKGHPAITVGKGSISSLRRDDRGDIALVQVNGDLNPGNSGGPVVDSQGRLIGIAVATIKGTQIGLAIPAEDLTQVLAGRVLGAAIFKKKTNGNLTDVQGEIWILDRHQKILANKNLNVRLADVAIAGAEFEVEVDIKLLDPMRNVQNVTLHVARAGTPAQTTPNAQGQWDPLQSAQAIPLKLEDQKAVGGFNLPQGFNGNDEYQFQVAYINGSGKTIYSQPRTLRLNFNPGGAGPLAQLPPNNPGIQPPPLPPGLPVPPFGKGPRPPLGPGLGNKFGPENTVTLTITGIPNNDVRQAILKRLPAMIGPTNLVQSRSSGTVMQVNVAPVADPQAFAQMIDFGTVTGINGRTITVRVK